MQPILKIENLRVEYRSRELGQPARLAVKDLNLAVDSAQALAIPLAFGSLAAQVFAAASTAGRGAQDFSAAGDFLAGLSGVRLGCHEEH